MADSVMNVMESFGEVEDKETTLRETIKDRFNTYGVCFYYIDEISEFGRNTLNSICSEFSSTPSLESTNGPVSFVGVSLSGKEEQPNVVSSYLGEGAYFFLESEENVNKCIKQCLPSEDSSYVVTGDEFKGKSLVHYVYKGEYLVDPYEGIAFIPKVMLEENAGLLTTNHFEAIEDIADISTVQSLL